MTELFPAGTFTPDPRPNSVGRMLTAQYALDLKLLLRNGEQLLLTMFIPITLLIGLTLLPLGSFGEPRVAVFIPAIMALAVISTAFTGQAIAVAFQQAMLLGGIALALGWRPPVAGLLLGAVIIAVGTATFVAMGLLLGGTLRAEIVLAVANLLWFVFAGLGALTVATGLQTGTVPEALSWVARLTPSGALTEALSQAVSPSGSVTLDWFGLAVLAMWGAVCAAAALRWFRFT
jgi:ABC-2 type transport system permease protein